MEIKLTAFPVLAFGGQSELDPQVREDVKPAVISLLTSTCLVRIARGTHIILESFHGVFPLQTPIQRLLRLYTTEH